MSSGFRLGVSAFLAILAFAARASAEPTALERSLAQSLFDEGRTFMDQGRIDEACERFGRSQQLDPGGGTMLNLALCHEKQGKLATAWSEFNEALSAAVHDGRADREKFAHDEIETLKARLPHVVINVARENGPYVEVRIDGVKIPRAAVGAPVPVDPGPHVVEAGVYARVPFRSTLTFAEGESKTVEVPVLAPFTGSPLLTGATCPEGFTLTNDRCIETPQHVEASKVHISKASWIFGGVAAASLVVSGVTGGVALSASSDAKKSCNLDRSYCANDDGFNAASRARTMAWVSTITLGVGVAAAITAIVLPRDKVATPKTSLQIGPSGFVLRSVF